MEAELTPLLSLCERERAAARAFTLAVVVHTSGSTYRKPGALMAIAADGAYAGLLSGGCLESDLREHARRVIETGTAHLVSYQTGGSDDALWGLGVGCEGSMRILLVRVGPEEGWQPFEHLAGALAAHRRTAVAIVVEPGDGATAAGIPGAGGSAGASLSVGRTLLPGAGGSERIAQAGPALGAEVDALLERAVRTGRPGWLESGALRLFALPLALPPRLLLLGAGPDAMPIVDIAGRLAWKVTVWDHRPAYARAEHFPAAERVLLGRPAELERKLDLGGYEAAIVMSHHLPTDLEYLRIAASAATPYVGLLGPPHRRERLLADLGPAAERLRGRLRAPVGLDLGGRTPESIALAIVAEVHAWLHGREGRAFAEQRRWLETADA